MNPKKYKSVQLGKTQQLYERFESEQVDLHPQVLNHKHMFFCLSLLLLYSSTAVQLRHIPSFIQSEHFKPAATGSVLVIFLSAVDWKIGSEHERELRVKPKQRELCSGQEGKKDRGWTLSPVGRPRWRTLSSVSLRQTVYLPHVVRYPTHWIRPISTCKWVICPSFSEIQAVVSVLGRPLASP